MLCGVCVFVCLGKKKKGWGGGGGIYFCTIMNSLLPVQMAVLPRTAQGHGWLRPATGVVELSQCIIQVRCAL